MGGQLAPGCRGRWCLVGVEELSESDVWAVPAGILRGRLLSSAATSTSLGRTARKEHREDRRAARKLLVPVYYGLPEGYIRALAKDAA